MAYLGDLSGEQPLPILQASCDRPADLPQVRRHDLLIRLQGCELSLEGPSAPLALLDGLDQGGQIAPAGDRAQPRGTPGPGSKLTRSRKGLPHRPPSRRWSGAPSCRELSPIGMQPRKQ